MAPPGRGKRAKKRHRTKGAKVRLSVSAGALKGVAGFMTDIYVRTHQRSQRKLGNRGLLVLRQRKSWYVCQLGSS